MGGGEYCLSKDLHTTLRKPGKSIRSPEPAFWNAYLPGPSGAAYYPRSESLSPCAPGSSRGWSGELSSPRVTDIRGVSRVGHTQSAALLVWAGGRIGAVILPNTGCMLGHMIW
jgi:hypothetical protein